MVMHVHSEERATVLAILGENFDFFVVESRQGNRR
jgi:hypothetical protein